MSETLTVRTGKALHDALRRRAATQGKTVSEVVRDILVEAVAERPLGSKVGHLKGRLAISPPKDPWRKQLKDRNWRR